MGLEAGLGWGKSYTKNLPEGEGLVVLLKSFMSHEGSWCSHEQVQSGRSSSHRKMEGM